MTNHALPTLQHIQASRQAGVAKGMVLRSLARGHLLLAQLPASSEVDPQATAQFKMGHSQPFP